MLLQVDFKDIKLMNTFDPLPVAILPVSRPQYLENQILQQTLY